MLETLLSDGALPPRSCRGRRARKADPRVSEPVPAPDPNDEEEPLSVEEVEEGEWEMVETDIDPYDLGLDDLPLLRQEKPAFLAVRGRVLATLGDRITTRNWLAATAVTVVSAPPDLSGSVTRALNQLVPDRLRPIGASFVLRMDDGGAPATARTRFAERIRQALGWRDPVVIVISSPSELEPSLRAVLPPALPLAPLSAEILRDVLGILFPGDPPVAILPDAPAPRRAGGG